MDDLERESHRSCDGRARELVAPKYNGFEGRRWRRNVARWHYERTHGKEIERRCVLLVRHRKSGPTRDEHCDVEHFEHEHSRQNRHLQRIYTTSSNLNL